MASLKQSTTYTRTFLLVDSSDHVTGKTGVTPTVTLSKAGAAFGAAGGSVTEVSSGFYKIALTTTDTNTLGDLAFHATGTGCDPTDFVDQVTARGLDDLAYPATSGRSMVVDAAGLVDANAVKVGPSGSGTAQTARDVGASVLISSGTGTGQLDVTSGVIKANLAQILGTALTETAGQIAGAFKQFFNVATPTGTLNTIPTVTNLTNAPTSGDLTATMKTSVTTAATAATPALSGAGVTAVQSGLATSAALTNVQSDLDDIQTRLPAALVSGRMDSSVGAMAADVLTASALAASAVTEIQSGLSIPTAIENADALLKRDWTAVTGEADRSVLNALRALRNKWTALLGTWTIYKEDDTTAAWTSTVATSSGAEPIIGSDPT